MLRELIPADLVNVFRDYQLYDAWYSGDRIRISNLYQSRLYTPTKEGSFWAKRSKEHRQVMAHIPVAKDIAATSASFLFSEHPIISIPESATNTKALQAEGHLQDIIADGLYYPKFLEAAEIASAMGGVFLKVDWNINLAGYPILNIVQPDNALPIFQYGILQSVKFIQAVRREPDNDIVYWLVEEQYPGMIVSRLYKGSAGVLGREIDLNSIDETAYTLPEVVTGLEGLAVVYVPNNLPNPKYRGLPLGASDLDQIDSLMDSLDEEFTSLLRDIRLAKGRLVVPEGFVEYDKNTKEAVFDIDQEIFTTINAATSAEDASKQLTVAQFAIRSEEHIATMDFTLRNIFTNVGYSPQSFGMDVSGAAESGKALRIRERKSIKTTAKKAEYFTPALKQILQIALQIDAFHLSSGIGVFDVNVQVQDSIKNETEDVANSIALLDRARAISTETKVEMMRNDWTPEERQEEVDRIKAEQGMFMPSIEDSIGNV